MATSTGVPIRFNMTRLLNQLELCEIKEPAGGASANVVSSRADLGAFHPRHPTTDEFHPSPDVTSFSDVLYRPPAGAAIIAGAGLQAFLCRLTCRACRA
jgi:hypothetical protein